MRSSIEASQARKNELLAILNKALLARNEVVFSYVHGSFVEMNQFRDIDIAVYCDNEDPKSKDVFTYEFDLADQLTTLLRIPVDVRVLNNAPLGFQYYVTTGRVLTCRDEDLRCTFVENVWNEYLDYLPATHAFLQDMVNPSAKGKGK